MTSAVLKYSDEPVSAGWGVLREFLVLCILLAAAILIRLPFFFLDMIDWDESTFIVMGQSIADGHLPYTVAWDNKPPGGFYLFAMVQYLFPQNLVAIRLFGALMVGLSGFLVYRVSLRIMPREAALFGGLLYCIAATVLITPSGQAVMMQHIAAPFILLAVLLAVRDRYRPLDALLFGVLLACAILIRTNLAVVAAIGGLALVLSRLPEGLRAGLGTAVWGGLGGLLVLGGSTLPFLLSGQLDLYITSVVKVPLVYSAFGDGILETTINLAAKTVPISLDGLQSGRGLLSLIFWTTGLIGLLLIAAELRPKRETRTKWVIVIGSIVLIIATIANRHPWGHYLIQIMPFFAIAAGYLLWRIGLGSGWRAAPAFVLVLALAAWGLKQAYQVIADRYLEGKTLFMGQSFSIARFLQPRLKDGDTLYVTHNILLYWLLDKDPPLPITAFPSNVFREIQIVKPLLGEDYTTERVLNDILDRRPSFIVMKADQEYLSVPSFTRRIEAEYQVAGRQRDILVLEHRDRLQ